jgi:hypothetical protein
MTRSIRKLVAAPALTLGVAGAVLTGGGVALAASQGALHVPFTGHDDRSDHAPSAPASTNPGLTHTDAATPSAAETTGSPSAHPTPNASPSPSLTGLCRAFQAGATQDGKTNPAFSALAAAAGGGENISAYCVTLIGSPAAHPAATPTHQAATPTHPAEPTQAAHPTSPAPTLPEHPEATGH